MYDNMTTSITTPVIVENQSFLSPVSFKLTIGNDAAPNVAFFCTGCNLPGVRVPEVTTNFRGHQGFMPGDKLTYESLSVRFMIDEAMTNYQEILKWLVSHASNPGKPNVKDLTLAVMTGKNTINAQIKFVNAFPTSLSPIEFFAQSTDIEYVTGTVTFRYDYFEVL